MIINKLYKFNNFNINSLLTLTKLYLHLCHNNKLMRKKSFKEESTVIGIRVPLSKKDALKKKFEKIVEKHKIKNKHEKDKNILARS